METPEIQAVTASAGLLRSTGVVSSMTMLSRVLGLLRDMLIAHFFGATGSVDAFYVAFKIPNFMRRLFAEGAFSQAFVPVLSDYQTKSSHGEVRQFIARVSGTLGLILLIFTVVAIVSAPLIISVFAPGFLSDPIRFELAIHFIRITFPYLLFISLTAMMSSVLNAYKHFAVPAFTPVLLNVSIILSTVIFSQYFNVPITACAWGVMVAGICQFLFVIPFLAKKDLCPRPIYAWHDPGVRRVLKLMVPALFGVSVAQLNLLLDTLFASFLPAGSVSWLYYSDRLMNFPLGVFGVAISTVILPHLSRKVSTQSHEAYSQGVDWSIRMVLLIGVPAAAGLWCLAGSVLTALFQYGAFTRHDVVMTQWSLQAFAFGVPAFMLIKVLASGFYAHKNIKTPVKIGACTMLANTILNLILIGPMLHAGLALATSISGWLNALSLLVLMQRYGYYQKSPGWLRFGAQLFFANGVMVIFLLNFTPALTDWFRWQWSSRLSHLFFLILTSMLLYILALLLSGVRAKMFRL